MITLPAALAFRMSWGCFAVLIYLFRDDGTENLALTIDVTGGNLPPITTSTDWIFLEAIDTLRSPPPWDVADFQRLLRWLNEEGFYLFEEHVEDPKKLPAQWARLRPQMRQRTAPSPSSLRALGLKLSRSSRLLRPFGD